MDVFSYILLQSCDDFMVIRFGLRVLSFLSESTTDPVRPCATCLAVLCRVPTHKTRGVGVLGTAGRAQHGAAGTCCAWVCPWVGKAQMDSVRLRIGHSFLLLRWITDPLGRLTG